MKGLFKVGVQKKKKDFETFVGLHFANNIDFNPIQDNSCDSDDFSYAYIIVYQ
jgi:hypothetical protein